MAQDMPPILAPLAPPVAAPAPMPASPSAQAIIPPVAVVAPLKPSVKPHVASAAHPATAHHRAKFAALMKRLTAARAQAATHRVALRQSEPSLPPPGTIVPPPGYYASGPRERLVYGGPPPGVYGGWGGYRGRYPSYYP